MTETATVNEIEANAEGGTLEFAREGRGSYAVSMTGKDAETGEVRTVTGFLSLRGLADHAKRIREFTTLGALKDLASTLGAADELDDEPGDDEL